MRRLPQRRRGAAMRGFLARASPSRSTATYTGQGSNTFYTIIGFLGVTVVKATGHGSNEDIAFQPMLVIDPTATTTTPGSGSNST